MSKRIGLGVALVLTVVLLLVVASRSSSLPEAQVSIAITNQGHIVRAINLGESRWSGAAYELFKRGEHVQPVATAGSGETVLVAAGQYDLKLEYSDGRIAQEKWVTDVSLHDRYQQSIELNVPESAVGPQSMRNTWEPN